MLRREQLHEYQRKAIAHVKKHPESMLWMQPGLGKTPTTLTVIQDYLEAGLINRVLIFGPLRVIESVWHTEAKKWEHTQGLRCSIVRGNTQERYRKLFTRADVYLINYEQMNWVAEVLYNEYIKKGHKIPFEMVVYDEITKVKNSNSMRMKGGKRDRKVKDEYVTVDITGWRKVMSHFEYRIGLTGSPAANGYLDLHGQFLVIDDGKRLGEYVTHYKNNYFDNPNGTWKYIITPTGKQIIESSIADITLRMDAEDYLKMPAIRPYNIMVDLPPKAFEHYKQMEKAMFTELDSGEVIEVVNAASLYNKLLQMASGSPYYDDQGNSVAIHDAKLNALEDLIEEAAGSPVLVAYWYKPDAERIMKKFKKLNPVNLTTCKDINKVRQQWQAGEVTLAIGHSASVGHGLDGFQTTGSIIAFYSIHWSFELYDQMIRRLYRQGQKRTVSVAHIMANDTLDLAVMDALNHKAKDEHDMKDAVDRYRQGMITSSGSFDFRRK